MFDARGVSHVSVQALEYQRLFNSRGLMKNQMFYQKPIPICQRENGCSNLIIELKERKFGMISFPVFQASMFFNIQPCSSSIIVVK